MQENIGEFIEFEGVESDLYIEEKRKAGKARHNKTDIIKYKIVKSLFLNKDLIKGKTVQQRADKINTALSDIHTANDVKLTNFATKYSLDFTTLKSSIDYFSEDKNERIYKWCLAFDKESKQI
jgi:hypothetical protein